jgi:hypothetical protein
MHGLINKAVEAFVTDTFGEQTWQTVLMRAGLWDEIGTDGFDTLRVYDQGVAQGLLSAASTELERPVDSLLEDLGTYLVSHPRTERLRRLLRFGGGTYTGFLRSLDDLQGRVRLAVPDLEIPALSLVETEPGQFRLTCHDCPAGFAQVLLGVLRAMGDDYGALVVLDSLGGVSVPSIGQPGAAAMPPPVPENGGHDEVLQIAVHDPAFHAGRSFDLTVASEFG